MVSHGFNVVQDFVHPQYQAALVQCQVRTTARRATGRLKHVCFLKFQNGHQKDIDRGPKFGHTLRSKTRVSASRAMNDWLVESDPDKE